MIFSLAVQISGILNRETNTVNRSERLLRIPVADQLPIYETSSKRLVSKRHRPSVTWRSKIRDQGTQIRPYWWHGTRDPAHPLVRIVIPLRYSKSQVPDPQNTMGQLFKQGLTSV